MRTKATKAERKENDKRSNGNLRMPRKDEEK